MKTSAGKSWWDEWELIFMPVIISVTYFVIGAAIVKLALELLN